MAEWIGQNVVEANRNRIAKSPAIYDAGCGNGELLRMLDATGRFILCGSDVEPGHVEIAKERTGIPWIFCKPACDAYPVSGFVFDAITAIGWLHNDWPSLFATGIPAREADPNYLRKTFQAFNRLLPIRGILIFDKIQADTPELAECGFRVIESKTAPCGDTFHIAEKVA